MRVFAIDAATCSGWAVDRPDGRNDPLTGTFRVPDGSIGRRLLAYARWLADMIAMHRPEIVYCEAPLIIGGGNGTTRQTTQDTVILLMGLYTHTATVAERFGLPFEKGHIQQVRRHFCGNGNAKKRDVFQRCHLLNWRVGTTDAADAAAIWCYGKAKHDQKFRLQTAGGGALFGREQTA